MYAEDYDTISEIKKLADEFDVAILIIHHLKKAKESDDWINEFSGSQGIAGSADSLFSLKRQRTDNHAILHRTGRDVEEKDFALRLDGFGWVLEGDAELFTMPEWKRNIINYIKEHGTCTPMDLAVGLTLNINTIKTQLTRLLKDSILEKTGRGTYKIKQLKEVKKTKYELQQSKYLFGVFLFFSLVIIVLVDFYETFETLQCLSMFMALKMKLLMKLFETLQQQQGFITWISFL